jgi:hypothetical protein
MKSTRLLAASLLAFAMFTPPAHAQTNQPMESGRSERRAMFQEMAQACANKSAGAPCSFSREGQTVNGTCRQNRRGQLVCRSAHGRHGGM